MLEKAMTLCGARSFPDQLRRPALHAGCDARRAAAARDYFSQAWSGRGLASAFSDPEGEDVIHNLDQKDEEAIDSGLPLRRGGVDLGGARTAL